MLATSRLGQAILDPEDESLPYISDEEEQIIRTILKRINGEERPAPASARENQEAGE